MFNIVVMVVITISLAFSFSFNGKIINIIIKSKDNQILKYLQRYVQFSLSCKYNVLYAMLYEIPDIFNILENIFNIRKYT